MYISNKKKTKCALQYKLINQFGVLMKMKPIFQDVSYKLMTEVMILQLRERGRGR